MAGLRQGELKQWTPVEARFPVFDTFDTGTELFGQILLGKS